jgi:hypothetical protein
MKFSSFLLLSTLFLACSAPVQAGNYDPDSDVHIVWRVAGLVPDAVILSDMGTEVTYPWASWTGPGGARAQAEISQAAWDGWNLNTHPNQIHRTWYAAQNSETRARLRARARTLANI